MAGRDDGDGAFGAGHGWQRQPQRNNGKQQATLDVHVVLPFRFCPTLVQFPCNTVRFVFDSRQVILFHAVFAGRTAAGFSRGRGRKMAGFTSEYRAYCDGGSADHPVYKPIDLTALARYTKTNENKRQQL
ncbi:MAG: hypothetical protein V4712_06335 [Pseudomonadota bacterium]